MSRTFLSLDDLRAHDLDGGRFGRWLCPLPACAEHTNPLAHRSLKLEDDSGLWYCHRCGAGGQLKEKWKEIEPRRPWENRKAKAKAKRERRRAVALSIVKGPLLEEPAAVFDVFRLGSLRPVAGSPGAAYLGGRGIDIELAHAAGVRFAPDYARRSAEEGRPAWSGAAAVVFPIRGRGGKMVAAQGRYLAPCGDGAKMTTFGPKSAGVFATPGALDTGGPVAVVEAPIDALSLAAVGLPAVSLCGTSGTPAWLRDALAWRPVLLAFDADDAGDRASEAFAVELARVSMGRAQTFRLRPPAGLKDWNDVLQEHGVEGMRLHLDAWIRDGGHDGALWVRTAVSSTGSGGEAPEDASRWDRPAGEPALPDLTLLDQHLTWPPYQAETPERLYLWLVRTLVKMVATAGDRAECEGFLRCYEPWVESDAEPVSGEAGSGLQLDLDDLLAAATKKQDHLRANLAERERLSQALVQFQP
mgnify:CR=1 FL=1